MIRVWYHANCYDGFTAAWAAWLAFGDDARYVPCSYGEPMPAADQDDEVWILDFSFPRADLVELSSRVKRLTVLDHHKTAAEDLRDLPFGIFDMERSGAGLAWDHLHPDEERPLLVDLVEDRDLWRFKLDGSREVHAYLCTLPFAFREWDAVHVFLRHKPDELFNIGHILLRAKTIEVEKICKNAWLTEVAGVANVAVVNTSAHWSEVGHKLLELYPDSPFSASFTVFEGEIMWSLRSRGDVDVGEVAKRHKGGGHRAAAGFRAPFVDTDHSNDGHGGGDD